MMSDLHKHYDQLTEEEREALDWCYNDFSKDMKACDVVLANDDRAEEAVNAIAKLIIESRAPEGEFEPDESMDGDHESALSSAGWGTDEDYGDFGSNADDDYVDPGYED